MSTASLAQILPIAADATSFDPRYDRAELVKAINRARHLLFSFANGREAFAKIGGQLEAQCFQPGDKRSRYIGLTLPHAVLTLDKLRLAGGTNVPIFAEHSFPPRGHCPMKAVHLPGRFFFQKEPSSPVYFRASDSADYGKRIGLEYRSLAGTRREDLPLGCEPIGPSLVPLVPGEVSILTLPHDRQGWVIAEDEAANELASYHPKVQPGFVRYALHGIPAGTVLHWWGTREPFDVIFDTDPVEFSDPSLWEELLKFSKLKRKEARSAAEQRAFQDSAEFLKGQIEQALLAQQGDREHLNFRNSQLERDYKAPLRWMQDIR